MLFPDALGYSLSCAIMPRFIINIRELYQHDLRNRWQGIDTGFGVLSRTYPSGDAAPGLSAVIFADIVERGQAVRDDEDHSTTTEGVGDRAADHA